MSYRPSRRERVLSALEIHRSRTKHSMIMLMGWLSLWMWFNQVAPFTATASATNAGKKVIMPKVVHESACHRLHQHLRLHGRQDSRGAQPKPGRHDRGRWTMWRPSQQPSLRTWLLVRSWSTLIQLQCFSIPVLLILSFPSHLPSSIVYWFLVWGQLWYLTWGWDTHMLYMLQS